MSKGEPIPQSALSLGVLPPAFDGLDALRNLCTHCALVLDVTYLHHRTYASCWPTEQSVPSLLREPRVRKHVASMVGALQLINPGLLADAAPPHDPPALIAFLRLFRGVTDDLVLRTDERSVGIRRQVRAVLETALLKFPSAFVWYAYEVFENASDHAGLLANLAIATTHARCTEEFTAVRAAHEWAIDILRKKWTTRPDPAPRPDAQLKLTDPAAFLTRSQREVLDHCVALAEVFYSAPECAGAVRPRLSPLILAPTGAGKTHLVKELARRIGAELFRIQRATYTIQNAKSRPTTFTILDTLVKQPTKRVIVFVDELDKLRAADSSPSPTSDWGNGVFGELFDILGGDFPVDNYCAEGSANITAAALKERVRRNIFLVGAGTFQSVFESAARPSLGFAGKSAREPAFGEIVAANIVSRELLARFHWPPLILRNPDPAETRAMFGRNGVAELAAQAGYELTEGDYDLREAGFRAVENLVTRLLLLRRERRRVAGTGADWSKGPTIS